MFENLPTGQKSKTPDALKSLSSSLKSSLDKTVKATVKGGKQVFDWLGEFFKQTKEKGSKAALMGPIIGLLTLMSGMTGKLKAKATALAKKQPENTSCMTDPTEARKALRQEVGVCTPLPDIAEKIVETTEKVKSKKFFKESHQRPEWNKPHWDIVRAAKQLYRQKVTANHCWHWTEKVYALAGFKASGRHFLYNSVPRYAEYSYHQSSKKKGTYRMDANGDYIKDKQNGTHYRKRKKQGNCKNHHVLGEYGDIESGKAYLRRNLKPGDHYFLNNGNGIDGSGNHSEIFLGWANKDALIAHVVGYPGKGNPPYMKKRRLAPSGNKKWSRVTAICKPILTKKSKKPLVA